MVSIGPAKILIVLVVALIVLGPEKLPQMSRQVGKAWGDFRRFREHLEGEVRGALGDDLGDLREPFSAPWSAITGSSSATSGTQDTGTGGAPEATTYDGGTEGRAPPGPSGWPGSAPPGARTTRPAGPGAVDPGVPPDDPTLN